MNRGRIGLVCSLTAVTSLLAGWCIGSSTSLVRAAPLGRTPIAEGLLIGNAAAFLDYANLSDANLSGTLLNKALLSWANLSGANLDDARLRKADLRGRTSARRTSAARSSKVVTCRRDRRRSSRGHIRRMQIRAHRLLPRPGRHTSQLPCRTRTCPSMPAGSIWSRSRSASSLANASIDASTATPVSAPRPRPGRNAAMPTAPASSGCSQPKKHACWPRRGQSASRSIATSKSRCGAAIVC
jgi:hypothetical protein